MTDLGGRGSHRRAVRPAGRTADLPPGYPQEYQRLVTLRDGRSVLIRPIQPGDAPALAEAIESADAGTIRRRFLGGHPQVTPGLLDYLTTVDYTGRFALIAGNRPVTALINEAGEPANQVTSGGIAEFSVRLAPGSRALGHDHEGPPVSSGPG